MTLQVQVYGSDGDPDSVLLVLKKGQRFACEGAEAPTTPQDQAPPSGSDKTGETCQTSRAVTVTATALQRVPLSFTSRARWPPTPGQEPVGAAEDRCTIKARGDGAIATIAAISA